MIDKTINTSSLDQNKDFFNSTLNQINSSVNDKMQTATNESPLPTRGKRGSLGANFETIKANTKSNCLI
jgi:hypothetical protein